MDVKLPLYQYQGSGGGKLFFQDVPQCMLKKGEEEDTRKAVPERPMIIESR